MSDKYHIRLTIDAGHYSSGTTENLICACNPPIMKLMKRPLIKTYALEPTRFLISVSMLNNYEKYPTHDKAF